MTTSQPVKLLGISGSPRKAGTDFLVQAALAYAGERNAAETAYYSVRNKTIHFCIHCDYCVRKKEGCIYKDDLDDVYRQMAWADAWILATPVYQGQVSGQLKTLLDRVRALVASKPKVLSNKVGAAMAVGGDRNGGQEPALQTIIDFYIINKMLPVGGGSFGANLGATVWSKDRRAQGARQDEDGMATMRKTVNRLMEVALLMRR